ncbi:hypothetical protein PILCRDRAFT_12740 [Piloderma croceum F 1598]|uniref:Uncharacterized protein n=1 Tax=Piloderma croceum (strain F 1598) TaxID=765440 RepID=A0A0C3BGM7_PILCF|nr:hypothetical protein PILCRDRAFT_12740 [Piloderma croceum F 1598]
MQAYLDQNADREKLKVKFRESMNYAKFSAPALLDDGHWCWFYNSGPQPQSILYRSKEPTLPYFSKEDNEGSNFATVYVRPPNFPLSQATRAEGEDDRFPDEVKWTKFSAITWSADSKGFLYQV